jgi:class 3 adenylate cyclase/tetratricopeptide (TPR) repeat protein
MPLLTIVFTDVVESSATKRDVSLGRDSRERDHAYLEKIQTRHFDLVRAACLAHGGKEVSTMGDAFYLTFEDPVEAVRCAVDIQRRLTAEPIDTPRGPLRLRIGIHSGFPAFFEESWHGTDVDTAARVEATATACQILLSSRTYELVRQMTDVPFHARGEFALKGVDHMALWEADWDGRGPRPTAVRPLEDLKLKRAKLRTVTVLTAMILLGVSTGYLIRRQGKSPAISEFTANAKPRLSVAVLGFKNLGKVEEDWLSNALPEMLNTELAPGDGLRMISGEDVAKTTADLAVERMPSYGKNTLAKLRSILKSDYVLAGSYVASGNLNSDEVRLDVRLQDAISGEIISSLARTGSIGTLPAVLKQVGAAIRAKLGVQEPTETETAAAQAALVVKPEARRLYTEGLVKLRTFDALGARDPLERTIAMEPNWAAPHAALANAWQILGYDAKAREEAKKAVDRSGNLSQVDRRSIEGRYRELNAQWDEAIEIYRDLWGVFQDEPNFGLELARVQTSAGKGQDALGTLQKLTSQPEMSDDPRIDLARAFAAESLSDVKQQQSAAAGAAEKASSLGSRYLAAQAYWQDCSALYALGDLEKAMAACQKSTAMAPFAMVIEARTKTVEARIMVAQGRTTEALEMHQQALDIARKIGSEKDAIGALMNLANIQAGAGQITESQAKEREAIEIARKIGDKQQLLGLENDLASDFQMQGDYKQARKLFEDSLKNAKEIGDQDGTCTALQNLGALSLLIGDLAFAESEVRQGLAISESAHLQSKTAFGLNNLGDIQMVKGNFAEARKNYESGLKLFMEVGDQPSITSTRLSLAKLALEEGRVTEAETMARQAFQEFQAGKLIDNEVDAQITLAQALISKGNVTAAQAEMESAAKMDIHDEVIKILRAIAEARLKAQTGNIERAGQLLDAQLAKTKEKNLVSLEFEVRLAVAELNARADSKSNGTLLTTLQSDAKNSGFLLVASKVERLKTSRKQ